MLEKALREVVDMLERVSVYVRSVLAGETEGNVVVGRYLMDTLSAATPALDKGRLEQLFNSHLQVRMRGGVALMCADMGHAGYADHVVPRQPRPVAGGGVVPPRAVDLVQPRALGRGRRKICTCARGTVRSAVEYTRVLHVVARSEDLAERPRARGVCREYIVVAACGWRAVYVDLVLDEGADTVQEHLLCGVRPNRVESDGGGKQAARMQEQVQIQRALERQAETGCEDCPAGGQMAARVAAADEQLERVYQSALRRHRGRGKPSGIEGEQSYALRRGCAPSRGVEQRGVVEVVDASELRDRCVELAHVAVYNES